jgi:hypothetical protein
MSTRRNMTGTELNNRKMNYYDSTFDRLLLFAKVGEHYHKRTIIYPGRLGIQLCSYCNFLNWAP